MTATGFVERVEKAIICSTWKKQPKIIEDFVKNTVLETIKTYTVSETKTAVKEKRNLLKDSIEDSKTTKLLMDGQKYAGYIPEAYYFFTPSWVKDMLVVNRRDLIIGLNLEELCWLSCQIGDYLEFIFKKQKQEE